MMKTTKSQFIEAFTENWLNFIEKQLWIAYDSMLEEKVKEFEKQLIEKRDQVVSWAVLHMFDRMDINTDQQRIMLTIQKVTKG